MNRTEFQQLLFKKLPDDEVFSQQALRLFSWQAEKNAVYRQFIEAAGIDPSRVRELSDIPFLPIQLFKTNEIKTGEWESSLVFESSRTTGATPSRSHVRDPEWYVSNAAFCFETLIGPLADYRWYALLPSYLEQGNSSLVYMVNAFMQSHPKASGGFFLHNHEELLETLKKDHTGLKTILLGVSYALLDLADRFHPDLSGLMVMETGGMKGRGRDMPREELHSILKQAFSIDRMYSEYGMTELHSQAYSMGDGNFLLPPTMKALIVDPYDPYCLLPQGQQGRIHIIDLANGDTCGFIATDDLGRLDRSGRLEILGRTDSSDIRGCNLLYTG